MSITANQMRAAQQRWDAKEPPEFYEDDEDDDAPHDAKKAAADGLWDILCDGNPATLVPLESPPEFPQTTTAATYLTWLSGDAAKLLLTAVCAAISAGHPNTTVERQQQAAQLLYSFAKQICADYAEVHQEAWQ